MFQRFILSITHLGRRGPGDQATELSSSTSPDSHQPSQSTTDVTSEMADSHQNSSHVTSNTENESSNSASASVAVLPSIPEIEIDMEPRPPAQEPEVNEPPPRESSVHSESHESPGGRSNRLRVSTEGERRLIDDADKISFISNISLSRRCFICLGSRIRPVVADGCSHKFCRSCLIRWSHRVNTCPVCRVRFMTICPIPDNSPNVSPASLRSDHSSQSTQDKKKRDNEGAYRPVDENDTGEGLYRVLRDQSPRYEADLRPYPPGEHPQLHTVGFSRRGIAQLGPMNDEEYAYIMALRRRTTRGTDTMIDDDYFDDHYDHDDTDDYFIHTINGGREWAVRGRNPYDDIGPTRSTTDDFSIARTVRDTGVRPARAINIRPMRYPRRPRRRQTRSLLREQFTYGHDPTGPINKCIICTLCFTLFICMILYLVAIIYETASEEEMEQFTTTTMSTLQNSTGLKNPPSEMNSTTVSTHS